MKLLRDEKGIALVTALMLTLITLGISMVMLYLVTQNIQLSGSQKRYKNSLDAASGGVDIVTMDVLPYLIGATVANDGSNADFFKTSLAGSMPNLAGLTIPATNACLQAKLTTKNWSASCPAQSSTSDAKQAPDMTFTLQSGLPGFGTSSGFTVYSKIVSTIPGTTDLSGRNLEGQATTGQPPQDVGAPYLYRIEITGERQSNPLEKANLSVLYAY